MTLLSARLFAAALTLAPAASPAQEAADPRARVELVRTPKRIMIRDASCPERIADPAFDTTLRRRIVGIAAREWEAFRFSTVDIASVGLPAVPTLGTAGSGARPRTIVPDAINPPQPGTYVQRVLRVGRLEDDTDVTARIGGYWAVVPGQSAIATQNEIWRAWAGTGWAQPWSAAFVSWVMCEAGLASAAFPRSAQHALYVDRFFRDPGAAFAPHPVSATPEPGDLLCAGRAEDRDIADLEEARTAAAAGAFMHCDIVVGGAPDRLYLIGGNVQNAVSLTVAPLRVGRIEPNAFRRWFGLFKLRAPADAAAGLDRVRFTCLGKPDVEACLNGL